MNICNILTTTLLFHAFYVVITLIIFFIKCGNLVRNKGVYDSEKRQGLLLLIFFYLFTCIWSVHLYF